MRKIALLIAIAVSMPELGAAPIPIKPTPPAPNLDPQAKLLQGTWDWDPDYPQGTAKPRMDLERVVIKGDTITFHYVEDGGRSSVSAKFKLNAKATPKEMDFTPTEGGAKGKTYLARYEVKNGLLKICYRGPRWSRPKDFSDRRERGGATVFIYLKPRAAGK